MRRSDNSARPIPPEMCIPVTLFAYGIQDFPPSKGLFGQKSFVLLCNHFDTGLDYAKATTLN